MSIGQTDAIWWNRICEILVKNPNTRVILHAFDAPKGQLIRTKFIEYERAMKEKFVNYSDLSDDQKTLVMKRIHISSANIFASLNNLVNRKVLVVT